MTMAATAQPTHERISGEVIQVIPPSEHGDYAIGDDIRPIADGKCIIVVDTRAPSEKYGLVNRIKNFLAWIKSPGKPPDGVYDVIIESDAISNLAPLLSDTAVVFYATPIEGTDTWYRGVGSSD